MADPTPNPEPQPAAKTSKPGVINKRQEASIALAEKVVAAASKDDYSGILETEHEIAPDFIAQLGSDCATARGSLGQVVQNAVAKNSATGGKTGAKQALMLAIHKIQAAARQKYSNTQPLLLKDYYIGQKIDASGEFLEQVGTAILNRLSPPEDSDVPADVLPGVKAAKIAALSDALAGYTTAWSAQNSAQSDKLKGQFALKVLVKSMDDRRRLVQFAVDGEWTYDDPANGPTRREFGMSAHRPFVAVARGGRTPAPAPPSPPAALKRKAAKRVKAAVKRKKTVKTRKSAIVQATRDGVFRRRKDMARHPSWKITG